MDRVLVIGSSGSGKTTLARTVATRLRTPHIELDALFHGPNWQRRAAFEDDVDRASREQRWVIDGNYTPVRDLLWSRADTIVWLDLPRWLVEYRVMRRSFTRWVLREELWHGNREESPLGWFRWDHPVRWSWKKHGEYLSMYGARFADSAFAHARRLRLRSPAEVSAFVASL